MFEAQNKNTKHNVGYFVKKYEIFININKNIK